MPARIIPYCDAYTERICISKIVRVKREKVKGYWGIFYNRELQFLFFAKITSALKLRGLRWVRHVARLGEMRNS
jgi:hypothetical protein